MTRQDSLELFALLAAAYPREPMSEAQVALYEAFLAPYPREAVQAAALQHIAESPWFPRVSDLLARLTAGDQMDADEAWAEVQRQIRAVGLYGRPHWSHRAIAMAVAALGWDTVCTSTNPETTRAHFLRFFAAAEARLRQVHHLEALPVRLRQGLARIGVDGSAHRQA